MKINIIRELKVQRGTPDKPKEPTVELLMEIDEELLETYQSETGDYEDPPDQKTVNEWINSLITYALDNEDNWNN
jgi:hypothetical protein|tara:strand:+ start:236 stop:460 length:225 start_codon:yes stop_codon:yes gene_type:complete